MASRVKKHTRYIRFLLVGLLLTDVDYTRCAQYPVTCMYMSKYYVRRQIRKLHDIDVTAVAVLRCAGVIRV